MLCLDAEKLASYKITNEPGCEMQPPPPPSITASVSRNILHSASQLYY